MVFIYLNYGTYTTAQNTKPKFQIIKDINKNGNGEEERFSETLSRSNQEEVIIDCSLEESLEEHLSKILKEDDLGGVVWTLRKNDNSKTIK